MRAGARGYLLKGATQEETLRAIRAESLGEAIFGPAIAQRLMPYCSGGRPSGPSRFFPELTEREEVLTLLAQRHPNAEIAARLVLSPKTLHNHVSYILSKVQVRDRAEAMRAAWTAGLGGRQQEQRKHRMSGRLYREHLLTTVAERRGGWIWPTVLDTTWATTTCHACSARAALPTSTSASTST